MEPDFRDSRRELTKNLTDFRPGGLRYPQRRRDGIPRCRLAVGKSDLLSATDIRSRHLGDILHGPSSTLFAKHQPVKRSPYAGFVGCTGSDSFRRNARLRRGCRLKLERHN